MSNCHGTNEAECIEVKTEGQYHSIGDMVRNSHSRTSCELIHSPNFNLASRKEKSSTTRPVITINKLFILPNRGLATSGAMGLEPNSNRDPP